MVGRREGKAQQEQDEDPCLKAVGGDAVSGEEDGSHQLTLAGLEPGAEGDSKAAAIRGPTTRASMAWKRVWKQVERSKALDKLKDALKQ